MNDTTEKPRRASRRRTKRPALSVIRCKDLPNVPAPPVAKKPSYCVLFHVEIAVLWPLPAKPGDRLVANEFGVNLCRGASRGPESIVAGIHWENEEAHWDKLLALAPALRCDPTFTPHIVYQKALGRHAELLKRHPEQFGAFLPGA